MIINRQTNNMSHALPLWAVFIASLLSQLHGEENVCERIDYSWYKLRGRTTRYDDVRGHENLTIDNCVPRQIWMINRHGPRNPGINISNNMRDVLIPLKRDILEMHRIGRGSLCEDDAHELRLWNFDELMSYEPNFLVGQGWKQIYTLGERMRNHFPNLLNRTYAPELFYFGHSSAQRTVASLRAFIEGLFSQDDAIKYSIFGNIDPIAEVDCYSYIIAAFENNYEGSKITNDYATATKIFENIAESLSERTGIASNNFNKTIIITIYEACTHETSKNIALSPWCKVLSKTDLQRLLLREEIFHYTEMAYGNKYAEKLGCLQMKSLISTFNGTVENALDDYVMKAYFLHESHFNMIFTRMGCFKTTLTTDYLNSNFSWDISSHTPMGASLVAVLEKCDGLDEDYKLQFYLNEKPMGCCMADNTEPCSWNNFRDSQADFVLNCNEDYCDESASTPLTLSYNLLLIILIFVFIRIL